MSEPKTAAEALSMWLKASSYLGDDPMLSPDEVNFLAHQVTTLAEAEGIDLATLVPDEYLRSSLIVEAVEDQLEIEVHEHFLNEMDDVLSVQALDDGGWIDDE